MKQKKSRVSRSVRWIDDETRWALLDFGPSGAAAVVSHGYALAVTRAYFTNHPFDRVRELIPKNSEIIQIDVEDGLSLI